MLFVWACQEALQFAEIIGNCNVDCEIATNHSFSEVSDLVHLAFQLQVDFV